MRPDLIEEAREAARLLETAAGLVDLGWTTNANARLGDGTPCNPEDPAAACWCAQGALTAAQHELGLHTTRDGAQDVTVPSADYSQRLQILSRARQGLRKAIEEGLHPMSLMAVSITLCITNWNDDEAVGGAQVARTMRRGAAILRGTPPRCRHCDGMGSVLTDDGRAKRCDRCAGTGIAPRQPGGAS